MRYEFRDVTIQKWLKSVPIYGSYRKIKKCFWFFLDHTVDKRRVNRIILITPPLVCSHVQAKLKNKKTLKTKST